MLHFLKRGLFVFMLVTLGAILTMLIYTEFVEYHDKVYTSYLWRMFEIGLLSGLSTVVLVSRKEPSLKGMIVRHIIHYLLLVAILCTCIYRWGLLDLTQPISLIVLLVSITLIYIITTALAYYREKKTADAIIKKINIMKTD